ncbi:MAG: hypothetical protein Q7W45_03720 [Bacteroidota bacterium]|nr:hypothetical protein [Bacteroidota bacterium]MDP3143913.1 hypothetical protein [Bacteroidota bacterium]
MKTAIILLSIFVSIQSFIGTENTVYMDDKVEVIKNDLYKAKDLEALFKITYIKEGANNKRFFEVIKTNSYLKNFFLADYLLIEKVDTKTVYYPIGWTTNAIKEKDIKSNCLLIVKGEVIPMKPE